MGGLLILFGLAGFIFGLVNLVYPLGRLRVETRKQAGFVVAGSLVVMIMAALSSHRTFGRRADGDGSS